MPIDYLENGIDNLKKYKTFSLKRTEIPLKNNFKKFKQKMLI